MSKLFHLSQLVLVILALGGVYAGVQEYGEKFALGVFVGAAVFQIAYRGAHGRFYNPTCRDGVLVSGHLRSEQAHR